ATARTSGSVSAGWATGGSRGRRRRRKGSTFPGSVPAMPTPTSATAPSPRRPASAASPWAGRRRSFSSSAARRPMRSSTRGSCTRSRSARARPTGCPRSTSAGRRPESTYAWSCRRASSRRSTPAWHTASPASVRSARASSSRRANASTARSRLSGERALTPPPARRRAAPEPMTTRSIGARIPRNEDPRLLQGLGCFVDEVRYVGEVVAFVVADSRYIAEDAQALIEVEYEPLPVVTDLKSALSPGTPRVHADVPDNRAARFRQTVGDAEAALARAPRVLRERLTIERSCGSPIEARGVVAEWDARRRVLRVWDSTQAPLPIKNGLAGLFGLPEFNVEVVAPDVGGGFGTKIMLFYPEEILVPHAAIALG